MNSYSFAPDFSGVKAPDSSQNQTMITMEQALVCRPNKLVGLWIVGRAEGLKRDAFVRACGKTAYLMIIFDSVPFPLKYMYVECHLIRMPHAGDSDEMARTYFNLCSRKAISNYYQH